MTGDRGIDGAMGPRPVSVSATSAPRGEGEPALPPTVAEPRDRDYLARRLAQHTGDWYCGIRLQKFPEDLRTYEHLIWDSAATVVIELGCHRGGSALWLRDRLVAMARYREAASPPLVVGVSLDTGPAREGVAMRDPSHGDTIAFVDGSVEDPEVPDRVAALIPDGARCLVIEDTAHEYDTTTAALAGFARFIPTGGYFVVEDGVVDDPDLGGSAMGAGGVTRAVDDWLASPEGSSFVRRRDLELYGMTTSPGGWLQRHLAA